MQLKNLIFLKMIFLKSLKINMLGSLFSKKSLEESNILNKEVNTFVLSFKFNTYILKIIEENRVYDRKINTSFFQRDVNSEFCQKEYVGINYDNDLSIIEVNVGVPIDVDDFKRGE